MKRILLIYPGHALATVDVARGLDHGFRALGCEVEVYYLRERAAWYAHMLASDPRVPAEDRVETAFVLAGEEIPSRALRFDPDAVLVVNGEMVHPATWTALERLARKAGYELHLVLTECPYQDEKMRPLIEQATEAWANDRVSAERYGCRYLAAAYDPLVHHPPEEPLEGYPEVLFIGTGWAERVSFFRSVDWSGVDLRIIGPREAWEAARGTELERHIENALVPGTELWRYYAGSGAVLNLHRQSIGLEGEGAVEEAWSLNPRCYQVPASGGLLLTDPRPEMRVVFGDALPCFESPSELGELARYFLSEPAAREDAIRKSLEAVRPHTYTARASEVLEEIG